MIKKILSVMFVIALTFPFAGTTSAYGGFETPLGYVEEVGPGVVKGWVYQNDQAVELELQFENSNNPSDTRIYSITNQQESNKIAYFSQREDVKNYLRAKYNSTSFRYPQGFLFTANYLPTGPWKLKSVRTATGGLLPFSTPNRNITTAGGQPYVEGYIDTTTEGIKGWAYSSSRSTNEIAPEIQIAISRLDNTDSKIFTLPRDQIQSGWMVRTSRQDVIAFLTNRRGQSAASFDHPNEYRGFVGFSFAYSFAPDIPNRPLGSGTWMINSVLADGEPVVYGNTKPSSIIYVP